MYAFAPYPQQKNVDKYVNHLSGSLRVQQSAMDIFFLFSFLFATGTFIFFFFSSLAIISSLVSNQ